MRFCVQFINLSQGYSTSILLAHFHRKLRLTADQNFVEMILVHCMTNFEPVLGIAAIFFLKGGKYASFICQLIARAERAREEFVEFARKLNRAISSCDATGDTPCRATAL